MVFEVELKNVGQGPDSFFYIAQEAGERNLPVTIDSSLDIDENGHVIQLYQNKPVIKQITIGRGYLKYEFPLVKLTLKSMCEADMNVNKGAYKTIPLSNTYDENQEPVLKWLRPCPEVNWAGSLKRDRKFLFNIESQVEAGGTDDRLEIAIFNPLQSKQGMNLTTLVKERNLEHIWLQFGMVGTPPPPAKGLNPLDEVLDFITASEDTYGFASLGWKLEGIPQGAYEIQLQSKCMSIVGSPSYVKEFWESTIVGVYDITRPEQYGYPAPIRKDILIGEEISVYFTEDMWCRLPYTFEMKVHIIGTNYTSLTRDQLLINCSGKKLGFQLDYSIVEVSKIIGKEFTVEIGNISNNASGGRLMDKNLNPMDPLKGNIEFKKRFANLDLSSASTAFMFTMKNITCTNASVQSQSDDVRQEIASIVGITSVERVKISGLICQNNSTVITNAEILPSSRRRLRNKSSFSRDGMDSSALFYLLKNSVADKANAQGRKLVQDVSNKSYDARAMIVKPSSEDIEKFQSSKEEEKEEMKLVAWAAKEENSAYIQDPKTNDKGEGGELKNILQRDLIMDKILEEKDEILNKVLKEKDEVLKALMEEKIEMNIVLKEVLKEKKEVEGQIQQMLRRMNTVS